MLAFLLDRLDPQHAAAIRRDAARIGRNRELAGVHYPSDTAAGASLARQIVDRLLANEEFRRLMDAAKAEWRQ